MINYQGQITIEQILAEIRGNPGRPFLLHFCKATGKGKGDIRAVAKCVIARPKEHYQSPYERRIEKRVYVKRGLMVDQGRIGLEDSETGKYFTPLMSHFMAYNLKKIIHS